jgi:hypothetical protein
LKIGLNRCKPKPRDIIIFTDADEIVRKEKVDEIIRLIDREKTDLVFGSFLPYCGFLNRLGDTIWNICIATSYENFSKFIKSGENLRDLSDFSKGHAADGFRVLEKIKQKHPKKKWSFGRTLDTGWHFSTLGGYQKVLQKLASQSHVANNTEEARSFELHKSVISSCQYCRIDSTYPQYVIDHEAEFRARGLIDEEQTTFH